ncbi:M23 family metallopeptidase [Microbacterium paraoxydans]|nr:M23 family metallopeptidase [Microbacterium paraoxydans]
MTRSRKDPVTSSLASGRSHEDAPLDPAETAIAPQPPLRRDRRRASASAPQEPTPTATPAPSTRAALRARAERPSPETAPSTAPEAAAPGTDAASTPEAAAPAPTATPEAAVPKAAAPAPASTPEAPAPETAAAPEAPAPETATSAAAPRTPRFPRGPRRPRLAKRPRGTAASKIKALGAVFAVGVMVTGAALPVLAPGGDDAVATVAGAAALKDAAQSYTATDAIRATISARGSFAATTPEEIKETHARAAAAAIAAGMPLSSAMDIPVADRVVMPMADGTYSFTDGFGASRPGRSHLGQDFAAGIGTPINAAMKGCVSRSTESYQGYGVTIQIESIVNGQAVSTVYSHLKHGTRAVEVGDCVEAGQYIGDVGSTGYVFGSCLHFEVHINTVAINPLPWLRDNVS